MRETRTGDGVVMVVAAVVMVVVGLATPAQAHFGSCEDHTPRCARWASQGDCQNRRQFMLQNCPVSCNACVDPNCYDRSNRCSPMAQRGLCESQRSFMLSQCPHSCDACRIGQPNAVAFTNLRTIINPDFECGRPLSAQAGRKKRQIYFPGELRDQDRRNPTSGNRNNPTKPSAGRFPQQPQPGQFPQQPQPGRFPQQPQPGQFPQQPQGERAPQESEKQVVPLSTDEGVGESSNSNLGVDDTFCGATPITDRFLLTAAHCVFDPDRPVRTVRLGELDFAQEGENNSRPVDYTVEQIIVHPDFDPSKLERYNDVAVLQLVERIQFNELVYPFCLSDEAPAPGSVVTGAGFGLVNVTHRPTRLQEADLEVLEASRCEDIYRREQFLPQLRVRYPELLQGKSIFCASYPERSACQGDSGGPLYQDRGSRRFLVGIVGSGVSCRSNGVSVLPGLYVDVADHIEFIDSVVYSPARL